MSIFKKTSFWKKVEQTFGVIGATAVTGMGIEQVHYGWFIAIGVFGLLSKITFIWIEDHDNDGIIDIMQ